MSVVSELLAIAREIMEGTRRASEARKERIKTSLYRLIAEIDEGMALRDDQLKKHQEVDRKFLEELERVRSKSASVKKTFRSSPMSKVVDKQEELISKIDSLLEELRKARNDDPMEEK